MGFVQAVCKGTPLFLPPEWDLDSEDGVDEHDDNGILWIAPVLALL